MTIPPTIIISSQPIFSGIVKPKKTTGNPESLLTIKLTTCVGIKIAIEDINITPDNV